MVLNVNRKDLKREGGGGAEGWRAQCEGAASASDCTKQLLLLGLMERAEARDAES